MKKPLASFTASAVATLFSLCASAALTINSPADYATVSPLSQQFVDDIADISTILDVNSYLQSTVPSDGSASAYRTRGGNEYYTNSIPVKLEWSGSAASYNVKVWRSRDLAVDLNAAPVFATNAVAATSVYFYDPEQARNYTWQVTDGENTATGHFYSKLMGPRVLRTDDIGSDWSDVDPARCRLGRDLGGWMTSSGKIVKQGLIYRSAFLEYCAAYVRVDGVKYRGPLVSLRDEIGIKLDIDLREKYDSDFSTEEWTTGHTTTMWIKNAYIAATNSLIQAGGTETAAHAAGVEAACALSSIGEGIPRFNSENACNLEFLDYADAVNETNGKIAMWHTFTNFFNEANYPVIFHCQYGKDRTGTLAAVILGLLGVDKSDIQVDYALSWYGSCSDDYYMTSDSWRLDNFFSAINTAFPTSTYTTLSAQMEAYLKSCATAAGVTDLSSVDSSITAFKARMLEEPETAAVAPSENPELTEADFTIVCYGDSVTRGTGSDTVTMDDRSNFFGGRLAGVNVKESYPYWLSEFVTEKYNVLFQALGSTLSSQIASWSGEETISVKTAFTLPTSGSVTVSENFVFPDSSWGDDAPSFITPYFPLSENYVSGTTSYSIVGTLDGTRVRIQGESTDSLTVTALDALSNAKTIAAGTQFIPESTTDDLYRNAVRIYCMGGNDWIEVRGSEISEGYTEYSYTYEQHVRPLLKKIAERGGKYLIVSPCVNPDGNMSSLTPSIVEAKMAEDFGANYFNLRLAMASNAVDVASKIGVTIDGAWHSGEASGGLMADTVHLTGGGYKINAYLVRQKLIELGYVTVVDKPEATTSFWYDGAEKAAVTAGPGYTLSGDFKATEAGSYTATVSLKDGYTWADGSSGSYTVTWKIQKLVSGGETVLLEYDPSCSRMLYNIGESGNEYALIFNVPGEGFKWTVPANLENVRFLVVGGGGGGGASTTSRAGAGGGGGGIVTGNVNSLGKGVEVSITVGAGGAGGAAGVDPDGSADVYGEGAAASGGSSSIKVGDAEYATAYGGGGDLGDGKGGAVGGSNSGGRTSTAQSAATKGDYDSSYVSDAATYGNKGGVASYSYAAGGGGGATAAGGGVTYSSSKYYVGGAGGEGLESDITGTAVVYGAGGGGGSSPAKNSSGDYLGWGNDGGSGAGNGGGGDAIAARGAGGGGGHYNSYGTADGGDGSSGIVVLRFTIVPDAEPSEPDPEEPGDETVDITLDPDWGYVVESPGGAANEYAVVFTNHTATAMQWTAPAALQNVQFLVVGGGGGGGADARYTSSSAGGTGGGGGGGGGVVTGLVNFAKGSVINVTVGNGGSGGKKGVATRNITFVGNDGETYKAYGDSGKAGDSYFSVGGNVYVKAYAGGGDLGAKLETDSVSNVAEDGGSGSGARWKYRWSDADVQSSATKGFALDDTSLIPYYQTFGNKGGKNLINYSTGGGGGALTAGGNTTSENNNTRASGKGGEGLTSSITGTAVVYGSGGGGGSGVSSERTDLGKGIGAKGGTGAGDGNQTVDGAGTSAKANQGGGGGGGGYHNNGGNGGSGIVVFRFSLSDTPDEPVIIRVEKPVAVADLVYNGNVLTGVVESNGYTLKGNTATDAGEYVATATLAEGYIWADESTDPVEIVWSIAKADNTWTTAPSISKTTWEEGVAGEITYSLGTAASGGTVVPSVTKDGVAFTSDFTDFDSWKVGEYVITLTVAESDNYNELTESVTVTVTELKITVDAAFGYVVEDLGKNGDEYAIVFTNHLDKAMTWTAPVELKNVQFLVVGGGGGGGADVSNTDEVSAGAGGGGGGVVTGLVNLAKGCNITVSVGNGGLGGVAAQQGVKVTTFHEDARYQIANPYGNVKSLSENSSFAINSSTAVIAYGGGGDQGAQQKNYWEANAGGDGGSGAGTRVWADDAPGTICSRATRGYVNSELAEVVYFETFGEAGGTHGGYSYVSGGGGGATQAGAGGTSLFTGGIGGQGLSSDITGEVCVYGSGGGGGAVSSDTAAKGGAGGTGAGNGNEGPGKDGCSALANQGGGGGGGGGKADGGNGGSGIVVFRFSLPKDVSLPVVNGKEVEILDVFKTARVSNPIWYATEPVITEGASSTTIAFGGETVTVPEYYTVTLSQAQDGGYTVTIALKDSAKPVIANATDTSGNVTAEAIKVEGGKVKLHLENTHSALCYAILSATSLGDDAEWEPYDPSVTTPAYEQGKSDFEFDSTDAVRFFKADVKDE